MHAAAGLRAERNGRTRRFRDPRPSHRHRGAGCNAPTPSCACRAAGVVIDARPRSTGISMRFEARDAEGAQGGDHAPRAAGSDHVKMLSRTVSRPSRGYAAFRGDVHPRRRLPCGGGRIGPRLAGTRDGGPRGHRHGPSTLYRASRNHRLQLASEAIAEKRGRDPTAMRKGIVCVGWRPLPATAESRHVALNRSVESYNRAMARSRPACLPSPATRGDQVGAIPRRRVAGRANGRGRAAQPGQLKTDRGRDDED